MPVTQAQYMNAKEIAEEIQRLPLEAQQAILNMLHGAIAISDMYQGRQSAPCADGKEGSP